MSEQAAVPVFDLARWTAGDEHEQHALASEITRCAHHRGFFYVVNHGIDESRTARYFAAMQSFFDLPTATKARLHKRHSPHFRGWEELGAELTNNETDFREQLDLGPEKPALASPEPYYRALQGPNQWPDEERLPGFRATVSRYIDDLTGVAGEVLDILSVGLGLDRDHLSRRFGDDPCPYTKLIRYPAGAGDTRGVGVHKDSGFLTLLLQDENPGLEAQASDGTWFTVDPVPGSLVVNVGELMQMITHNYLFAAPHRVVNRPGVTRHSSAFFYSPDLDMSLAPLSLPGNLIDAAANSPHHRDAGVMASLSEMHRGMDGMGSHSHPDVFGEKYWQRWVRSYPEIVRRYYPDRVGE